jgi:xanthine/uracil permease
MAQEQPVELIYGVDDRPPWLKNLLYGVQWPIVFLPTIMILSVIASNYLALQGSEKVLFFQRILLTTGAIMVIQTLWGHQYPILDGPSSALLLSIVILAPHGMSAIQGGMLAGGCFLLLLSLSGLLRYIEALFTDNVVGVILILIAVTLLPYVAPMVIGLGPGHPQGDPMSFILSIIVIIAIALFSHWLRGFPKTVSLLLGILLGTAFNWLYQGPDLGRLGETPWFAFPHPLIHSLPSLSGTVTLAFIMAYLAVLVNSVGSIYSMGQVVGTHGIAKRVKRGIAATGIGGILAGALGGIGSVSYGLSPGVILVTRTGSRFTVSVCGFMLIFLALFQKVLAVILLIPAPVIGAAMVVGLASQIGVGISVLTRSGKRLDGRDYLVVGIPIIMGGMVSIFPEGFFKAFPPTLLALIKNGLIVGIVLVLILEHLLLPPSLPNQSRTSQR